MNNRKKIRQTIRLRRRQLSPTLGFLTALELSHTISHALWFRRSKRIAFYQATQGELDPFYLMQRAWEMHKTCYLPVCHPFKQDLLFIPCFPNTPLILNRYGILEPDIKKTPPACKPFALDLVFMPLLAFDQYGNRLGYGKGYYDKTFAYIHRFPQQKKPLLVGLAYDFQERKKLPTEPWDISIDKVILAKTS